MKAFHLSLAFCAAAMLCGIAALLVWGMTPPPWLAGLEAALLMGGALVYGFTSYLPNVSSWLWLRPIRGTVLVTLGVAAMYVPAQLILSAYLIGIGVRLIWAAACDQAEPARVWVAEPVNDADALAPSDMAAIRSNGRVLATREE